MPLALCSLIAFNPIVGRRRLALAWAAMFFVASAAVAETPAKIGFAAAGMIADLEGRVDALVSESIARNDMPGCVVLVGRRSGIAFEKAYGDRSVEPERASMTVDTVFDMASITKPVATATSVMILVERGQVRLRDTVAKFFPEFAANGKDEVTVEQLLIHSAGLIPDNSVDDYEEGWDSAKPKICELELKSEPGAKFKYSDVGFILLGKIVEIASGMPVSDFAQREVFDKLRMHDTGYLPAEELRARAATTEKRDDQWLTGQVHDPRAAKMGGVAGHAGLFSTARDMAIYATMMLREGEFGGIRILSPATVAEMTRPRDIGGQLRGLGWDVRTAYSKNRGEMMSAKAFGHGGFTGTVMWIDPELDLYVIFLSTRLHPDGVGEVNDLAGRIGAIACASIEVPSKRENNHRFQGHNLVAGADAEDHDVRMGIDVLVAGGFKQLEGKRVGLITNHTGRDRDGITTIDRFHQAKNLKLVALFGPEHGIRGALDQSKINDSIDEATGVTVYSLYGERRRPTQEQLADIDVLVFDIQDIGARFYTYPSTMGLAMEDAAKAGIDFMVLDRPNPIDGATIEGPLLDADRETFVSFYHVPVRHGMTVGELARMYAAEKKLKVDLTVIPVEGWRRNEYWHDTGLSWVDPSPNMRSETAAVLYPGIGLLETTNVSVGRGTDAPFEVMGAPWIRERELAEAINAANPPGVCAVPIRFTPTASKFKNESCGGVNFVITDWSEFRSFHLGMVVAHALRMLYPDEWQMKPYIKLLGSHSVFRQVKDGNDVSAILDTVNADVEEFRERRKPFELYQ